MSEIILDISHLKGSENTQKALNSYINKARVLTLYTGSKQEISVPLAQFNENPKKEQIEIALNLSNASLKDKRELIYEIGYGTTTSPLDTAANGYRRTVLGFDPLGSTFGNLRLGLEDVRIPSPEKSSFAAFFSLELKDLINNVKFPKAHRLQSFSPFTTTVPELIKFGPILAESTYIICNPDTFIEGDTKNLLRSLSSESSGNLNYMTKYEIDELIGSSKSVYFGALGEKDKLPVISIKNR